MPSSMDHARSLLKQHFGFEDFRPGQVDVVAAVLAGYDTLGVLPTGGGKSLCYQVPALAMSGLTVVISPLISLMKDQVDRLIGRGVPATLLNSTIGSGEVSARLARAARGELKLLYVAPERFEARDLLRCLSRCTIALLAVDEAHCISEWGHDFRPSFRRIADVSQQLGRPQLVALTATATRGVRRDIARQLGMRHPRVIVGGFDRTNLHYTVRQCRTDEEKDRLLTETVRRNARPAIVYASTRASVERLAKHLSRSGIRALPYHAGLDDAHRHEMQETFMRGGVDTIVATNAFGMGIDKPNVRLVVHYAMPGTLESYYQEAGRAGRDELQSSCILLHAPRDRLTHEWFIAGMYPDRKTVERIHDRLTATSASGRLANVPTGRDAESAIRLLTREQVVTERRGTGSLVVRLLATWSRIERELSISDNAIELGVLQSLERLGGDAFQQGGFTVDLGALAPGYAGSTARAALDRLRARQFVDFTSLTEGLYFTRLGAPLASFEIDWTAMNRRRQADIEKLEMMQRYAYTRNCRRAFVLRYFGESTSDRCNGCDNCLSR